MNRSDARKTPEAQKTVEVHFVGDTSVSKADHAHRKSFVFLRSLRLGNDYKLLTFNQS